MCAERPRRRRPLGGKTTLCFICVDPCRTRFHVRRSVAVAVYAPPKRASFTCAARWRSPCMRRRSVRLSRATPRRPSLVAYAGALPSGGRVLSAPPKRALSAPPKQARVRRHSVDVRECAAEACACTPPLCGRSLCAPPLGRSRMRRRSCRVFRAPPKRARVRRLLWTVEWYHRSSSLNLLGWCPPLANSKSDGATEWRVCDSLNRGSSPSASCLAEVRLHGAPPQRARVRCHSGQSLGAPCFVTVLTVVVCLTTSWWVITTPW